jgi:DNA-binding LytR/AlgR family response regulator
MFTIIFPKEWDGKKKIFHHIPKMNMLEIACEEESYAESHDALWLEMKGVKNAIMYSNIVCIRAFKGGCQVFTNDHTYELGISLKKVFAQLDARHFMFVHRNCIVRIEAVEEYSYHLLKMQDKQVVTIGKKYLTKCHAVWGKDGK